LLFPPLLRFCDPSFSPFQNCVAASLFAACACFGGVCAADAPRSRAARTAYHHQLSVHGRHQAGAKWAAAAARQGHLEVEGGGYGSYQHVQGSFGCWVWEGLPYHVCSLCQSDYVWRPSSVRLCLRPPAVRLCPAVCVWPAGGRCAPPVTFNTKRTKKRKKYYVCTGQVPGKAGLPAGFNRYALRSISCTSPTLLQRTT
jgi:hypothetical protein